MRSLLKVMFSKKFFGCEIVIFSLATLAGITHPKHLFLIGFYSLFAVVFCQLVKTYLQEA